MLRGYALDVYVHMDVLPVQDPVLRGLGVEVGFGIVQMPFQCFRNRILKVLPCAEGLVGGNNENIQTILSDNLSEVSSDSGTEIGTSKEYYRIDVTS